MKVKITGTGSYLPEYSMTNDEMAERIDTSDAWIRERTGIRKRHFTDLGTVHMAWEAARRALDDANLKAEALDMILVATVSPDYLFPSTACQLQDRLGARQVPCMDLSAACSGFLFAMNTAAAYLETKQYQKILVVGAETLSRLVDWQDRSTCILFGDGAGAVVMEASEEGCMISSMGCDGAKGMILSCEGQAIQNPIINHESGVGKLQMNGQEVFKFAVRQIPKTIRQVLEEAKLCIDDVEHFIMHQANQRILMKAAKELKIPSEKMPMNIETCGNLAAASIPVLLDESSRSGRLKRGDRIVLSGFGAGLSWGSTLLIW